MNKQFSQCSCRLTSGKRACICTCPLLHAWAPPNVWGNTCCAFYLSLSSVWNSGTLPVKQKGFSRFQLQTCNFILRKITRNGTTSLEAKKMGVALCSEIVHNLFWQTTKRCWEAGDNFDLDSESVNTSDLMLYCRKKFNESTKLFWILLCSFMRRCNL